MLPSVVELLFAGVGMTQSTSDGGAIGGLATVLAPELKEGQRCYQGNNWWCYQGVDAAGNATGKDYDSIGVGSGSPQRTDDALPDPMDPSGVSFFPFS
jgi:hypothetical protein